MLTALEIHGFRCLKELRVEPLTRVNLFVGKNGSGKTSVLEAVEILATGGLDRLIGVAVRREELVVANGNGKGEFARHTIDPAHLFWGRKLNEGAQFEIRGHSGTDPSPLEVRCKVELTAAFEMRGEWPAPVPSLRFESYRHKPHSAERLSLSPENGVLPPPQRREPEGETPVNFLRPEDHPSDLRPLWERIGLTPKEDEVLDALRILEPPRVERLAFFGEGGRNVQVRLTDSGRVPLGSLGGGLGRVLAVSTHLVSAEGGVLLIDEVDTGLHHSVMTDMWRLVIETAKRHDVQVFATTHSLDCVRALARVRAKHPDYVQDVTLHRVEKDRPQTVVYDMDDLVIAAESFTEVR
jgi:hypothetical protein